MTDKSKVDIAREQIDLLDEGHVGEDVAEWCFKISNGVANTVRQIPLSDADKFRTLRLAAVMLLNVVDEFEIEKAKQ